MNNFEIIESSEYKDAKWITYTPNNDKSFYGVLMDFNENENHSSLPIEKILNNNTSFFANRFVVDLVCRKANMQKYKSDLPRKLTLEEFLSLKQIIEKSDFKYNKKKKCLIEN